MTDPVGELNALKAQFQHMWSYVQTLEAQQQQLKAGSLASSSPFVPRHSDSHLPKLRAPATFSGAMGMVVDDWLSELKQQFAYYGSKFPDDTTKIGFAAAHLAGPAMKWWEQVDRVTIDSWDAFVGALHERFRPVQASMFARQRLGKLRMRETHSVNQYVSAFQTILTPITDMGEADKVHQFINGLLVTYFGRVWEKHPKTLKEAIDAAVSVEAIVKYGRDAGMGRGTSSYSRATSSSSHSSSDPMELSNIELESFFTSIEESPKSGSTGGDVAINALVLAKMEALDRRLNAISFGGSSSSFGHRGRSDRIPGLTADEITTLRKESKCFRCKQVGHMKGDCPKKPKNA